MLDTKVNHFLKSFTKEGFFATQHQWQS